MPKLNENKKETDFFKDYTVTAEIERMFRGHTFSNRYSNYPVTLEDTLEMVWERRRIREQTLQHFINTYMSDMEKELRKALEQNDFTELEEVDQFVTGFEAEWKKRERQKAAEEAAENGEAPPPDDGGSGGLGGLGGFGDFGGLGGFDDFGDFGDDGGFDDEPPKKKKNNDKTAKAAVILFALLLVVAIGMSVYGIVKDILFSQQAVDKLVEQKRIVFYREGKPENSDSSLEKNSDGKYTIAGAAELVKPSVVEIFAYGSEAAKIARTHSGTGSGIVLSEDGYIVTNSHVLIADGAHTVRTVNDKIYDAKIIGRDVKTDIAIIKIEGADVTPAVLGNSDEAVVGEQVIAIGNPASLSFTVTNGIISAVNRKISSDETSFEMDCIQTNADISPGNSGGALINMYGQVIGITSSKYVSSSYEGLGFAITINEALPIIEELVSQGYVSGRFRIGIQLIDMSKERNIAAIEEALGYELPDNFRGIYIDAISEDSDIINTELKPKDFITEINGKSVKTYNEFYDTISSMYAAGDTVPATCAHVDPDGSVTYYHIKFKLIEDVSGNY